VGHRLHDDPNPGNAERGFDVLIDAGQLCVSCGTGETVTGPSGRRSNMTRGCRQFVGLAAAGLG
jgi:hypothetical protein